MKWFPTVDFWVIFWPCNFRYRWPICLLKFITHIGFARSMHSRLQYKYLNLKLAFSYNWSHPQHPVTRETTSTMHCWLVHIDVLASHLELQGVIILTSITHYTCDNGSNCPSLTEPDSHTKRVWLRKTTTAPWCCENTENHCLQQALPSPHSLTPLAVHSLGHRRPWWTPSPHTCSWGWWPSLQLDITRQ